MPSVVWCSSVAIHMGACLSILSCTWQSLSSILLHGDYIEPHSEAMLKFILFLVDITMDVHVQHFHHQVCHRLILSFNSSFHNNPGPYNNYHPAIRFLSLHILPPLPHHILRHRPSYPYHHWWLVYTYLRGWTQTSL